MKLLLFQLLTNITIGSIVAEKGSKKRTFTVVDFIFVNPFHKGAFRSSWRKPFYFVVIVRNKYNDFDFKMASKIERAFKKEPDYTDLRNTL